ncbi:MAG: hypothetical protein C4305_00210 [Thermoleophilia bacterium]
MTASQWLLGFHVLGAFLFVSGAVAAGLLHALAMACHGPGEIALLLRLTRVGVAVNAVGSLLSLGLGIWLVEHLPGYDFGDAWIAASLALFGASLVPAAIGGRSMRHARLLAERLAAVGAGRSEELRRRLADPLPLALNYLSLAMVVAILALMVWKPA